MPRSKSQRALPLIGEVFPFPPSVPDRHRQAWLAGELRGVCGQLRKPKPQVFYSIREIVDFFGIPLRTVALAFKDLENEGLLNSLRGSRTLLTGTGRISRFPVRGVIGLPNWMNAMVFSSFTRQVNMEFETRLRKLGFVADMIFHDTKEEESHPDFAGQLLSHHLDAVIWQDPHPKSQQNLISLSERGVRLLVIQTPEAKTSIPAVIYLKDWRPGYEEIARRWQESGVKTVWIPLNIEQLAYRSEAATFSGIMREHGLSVEVCGADVSRIPRPASSRRSGRTNAIAFLESDTADLLCNCDPVTMERLSRFSRLAFCRGPLRCPYLRHRGVPIEVVDFSAEEIAKKLVEDIGGLTAIRQGIRHVFSSRYWPDNPAE